MPSKTFNLTPAQASQRGQHRLPPLGPGQSPLDLHHLPETDTVVLRVGELFLKGQNRRQFYAALIRNAKRLLADLDGVTIEPLHLRALVRHPPLLRRRVVERLQRLFGAAAFGLGKTVAADMDEIGKVATAFIAATPVGSTFKVAAKRRDKRFPLTSVRIARDIGERIGAATGHPVDVHRPEVLIQVEIGPRDQGEPSLVIGHSLPGPRGLPVGTGGAVGLLLSGGIDSPVAGWSAMRRGCRIIGIYFHSFPYTGDKSKEKVLDLARHLTAWQGHMSVYVMPFTSVQKALREHGQPRLAVLLYRRMMMRAASRLTKREGFQALVTGESLGQVASQTVENLAVIEDAATLPVLRPLIGFDKLEIIAQAQAIGTYETSILPYEDCCSLFVPKHPATRARIDTLREAEAGLGVDAMADELAEAAEHLIVGP